MRREKNFWLTSMFLLCLLVSVEVTPPVRAIQEMKTLRPIGDSDVSMESPDWNRGRNWSLFVERWGVSNYLAFLMFDLSGIPSGAAIKWTKLRLNADSVSSVSLGALVGVYYCSSNSWEEDEITYNNMPAFSTTPIDTANVTTALVWYEWNVTDTIQSTFERADKRLSLVLKAETFGGVTFWSKDNPYALPPYDEARPQLVIRYEAPESPGNDPLLPAVVAGIAIIAAVLALGLVYVHTKRRKQK